MKGSKNVEYAHSDVFFGNKGNKKECVLIRAKRSTNLENILLTE